MSRLHFRSCVKNNSSGRRGAVMVWCAVLLVVLLGMVGLIIDGGLLMAEHRKIQNAADSSALAAAYAQFRGESSTDSVAIGTTFVTDSNYNNIAGASAQVNIPPTQGPYAGLAGYAEAIVSHTISTYFIRVMGPASGTVGGYAVAGGEQVPVGAGVIALDPNATPGLDVSGISGINVDGAVFVNSTGGGEDEWGDNVGNGQTGSAVSNNATVIADEIYVSGGVNDLTNFSTPSLDASTETLYPDPLASLATPTTSNGVVNILRGAPQASIGGLTLNNASDTSGSPNYIITDPGTGAETMVLQPGIYESIKVTGGTVQFESGIYVLSPQSNTSFTVEITGGTIMQPNGGFMFYNTGDTYDPVAGEPSPPGANHYGDIKINSSVGLTPLNFDGVDMLIYYARWHDGKMQIEGNSNDGDISGTIYASSAEVQLSGQGVLNTAFVVGEMDVSGQGIISIDPDDSHTIFVTKVFLVD